MMRSMFYRKAERSPNRARAPPRPQRPAAAQRSPWPLTSHTHRAHNRRPLHRSRSPSVKQHGTPLIHMRRRPQPFPFACRPTPTPFP
eukprot:7138842-Prymnesium_polylepis.1